MEGWVPSAARDFFLNPTQIFVVAGTAQLVEHLIEKKNRCNADGRLSPRCGKGFFSESDSNLCRGRDSSVGRASDWEKKIGVMLMEGWVPGAARDFFLPVSFQYRLYNVRTATRCNPMHQQLLKISDTDNHATVWTHKNAVHTDRNGWHCSWGWCSLTQVRRPSFPQGTKEC